MNEIVMTFSMVIEHFHQVINLLNAFIWGEKINKLFG